MHVQAIALEAVSRAQASFEQSARTLSKAAAQTSDSVSLSTAAVALVQSQTAVEASLELAKTADEVAESALDLLA